MKTVKNFNQQWLKTYQQIKAMSWSQAEAELNSHASEYYTLFVEWWNIITFQIWKTDNIYYVWDNDKVRDFYDGSYFSVVWPSLMWSIVYNENWTFMYNVPM